MLTKNINFINFKLKQKNHIIKKDLKLLIKEKSIILKSLSTSYKYTYVKTKIKKFKKYPYIRIIGMGGSILGTESIYDFLKHKIKKNFKFIDNLDVNNFSSLSKDKKQGLELIKNSILVAKDLAAEVSWIAEDSSRADSAYLLEAFETAVEYGAKVVTFADTVGYALPEEISQKIDTIVKSKC